ncbi:DUF3300 domain-containing protein [Alteromonas sp. D210916BOD_24]|uniref:DUF3300 domain-containing protein n=1 Tax=Alteromonas sp. D210916BOD_24 TaxID=3157618 RepID=UPI00399CD1F1
MKRLTLIVFISLCSAPLMAVEAPSTAPFNYSETVSEQTYSDAQLDSMLAPIALYPDTLLTHILIAATYPLDVVAADRWRQSNQHLTPEQVENVLESVNWDPSVKALAPFTDLLHTMAEDLDWLQQLGDSVLIDQARVLDRVQILRQHAHNTGNLSTNDYIEVETERQRDREIIYIEPRQREIVYVPYYNPLVVYGHWWHATAPIYWHHRVSYHHYHNVYWAPRVRLSTFFYFGGVHWHNRHVVVHRTPVRRYHYQSPRKRVISHDYQRWEHRIEHRRARYSPQVTRSAPGRYETGRYEKSAVSRSKARTNSPETLKLRTDKTAYINRKPVERSSGKAAQNAGKPSLDRPASKHGDSKQSPQKRTIEQALKRSKREANAQRETQMVKRIKTEQSSNAYSAKKSPASHPVERNTKYSQPIGVSQGKARTRHTHSPQREKVTRSVSRTEKTTSHQRTFKH